MSLNTFVFFQPAQRQTSFHLSYLLLIRNPTTVVHAIGRLVVSFFSVDADSTKGNAQSVDSSAEKTNHCWRRRRMIANQDAIARVDIERRNAVTAVAKLLFFEYGTPIRKLVLLASSLVVLDVSNLCDGKKSG